METIRIMRYATTIIFLGMLLLAMTAGLIADRYFRLVGDYVTTEAQCKAMAWDEMISIIGTIKQMEQ